MQSKKQSDAKPPDGTVFFLDRSLGVEPLKAVLIHSGLVVEIHDDHFARDEEDRVWLKTAGERGWVVLTKDQRLRYRPLEIGALRGSNARVFVLTAGNLRGCEIGAVFLKALPRIYRILRSRPGPFFGARFTSRTRRDQLIGTGGTWKSGGSPNRPNLRFGVHGTERPLSQNTQNRIGGDNPDCGLRWLTPEHVVAESTAVDQHLSHVATEVLSLVVRDLISCPDNSALARRPAISTVVLLNLPRLTFGN